MQPGSEWRDVLVLSGHVGWLLSLYAALRLKFSREGYWMDCPVAVSARKLVVQFCSLTGPVFLSGISITCLPFCVLHFHFINYNLQVDKYSTFIRRDLTEMSSEKHGMRL